MKKIVFLIAIGISLGLSVNAQKKMGYINSQELLELMPEARIADSTLQKYVASIESQMREMAKELQNKFNEHDEKSKTWTDAVKEQKEKDITTLQQNAQQFQQSAEEKIQKKRSELYKPILEKAQKAIRDVGTEGGYDYIVDGTALLYAKDSENILSLVKAKLGIK